MSDAVRTLQNITAASSPSTPARATATVTLAVFFGLAASPLSETFIFLALVPLSLIWIWYLGFSLHTRGTRMNDYAPMGPDGDRPDPRRRQQILAVIVVPVAWALVWIGDLISSDALHWGWAVLVAVGTAAAMWRIVVLGIDDPAGYVPVRRLYATEPDWSPDGSADSVAAVLYAARAVPGGRQVRRDVLGDLAEPLVGNDDVDAALQELVAQGRAVVLRDRKDAHTVTEWTTLTDDGRDAVLHTENPAARP